MFLEGSAVTEERLNVQDEAAVGVGAWGQLTRLTPSLCSRAGVVPEQKIERATNETAERPRGPAARLLQGSKEDEDPWGATGGSRHSGSWCLRLLRR